MGDIIPNPPTPCNEDRTLSTLGWGLFWKQLLGQAGALLLLAGIICFFAFNWADMSAFAKFGIIIAGMLLAAAIPIAKGLDHFAGSVGLLFCGLLGGPLLAVFGQTYQTGADAWELFRAWALFLIPLALLGRQTGLWFAAWLVGTLWAVLWLAQERHMESPLLYSPFLLGQFAFLLLWESSAAAALRGLPIPRPLAWLTGPLEGRSFLSTRWFPRLLGVCLLSILTWAMLALTVKLTIGSYSSSDPIGFSWTMPYCLLLAAGGWWYARIHPDTLPHAMGLFSLASVLLTGIVSGLFRDSRLSGEVFFLSSLLFVGCGVAVGKAILVLHKKNRMTLAALQTCRATQEKKTPEMLRTRARQLWRTFRLTVGILERPAHAEEALSAMPWYGRLFIGLCAWVASFLLIGSLAASFSTLFGFLEKNLPLLGAALFFPLGFVLERKKSLFPQQLGLALLFAGASCLIAWLMVNLGFKDYHVYLAAAVVLIPSCLLVRNEAYRSLSALLCLCFLPLYVWWLFSEAAMSQFFSGTDDSPRFFLPGMIPLGLLYLFFCLGFAHLWRLRCMRPPGGFSASWQAALRPFVYGAFVALLCWGGLTFMGTPRSASYMDLRPLSLIGPASGIGLTYLLVRLSEDLGLTLAARLVAGLTAIGLAVLSWWLPWAGAGLFALTLARQAGNIPLQGLCIVFLAVFLNIEYYNLESSLLFKSITLCGLGLLLLLAAFGISYLLKKAIRAGHLPDPENIDPDTTETPDDPAPPDIAAQELSHA